MIAAAALAGCGADSEGEPELRFVGSATDGWQVELTGVSGNAVDLVVYTGAADQLDTDRSPVLGQLTLEAGLVRWQPRYQLGHGQTYTAVWSPADGDQVVRAFTTPAKDLAATTVVSAVYPVTEVVPENLLRLYVQFSAPMSRGRAREFLELVDDAGNPISGAFVVPEHELWSPASDRLTVFFDPGRLKQDVGPNLELGSPLRAGQTITLRVSAEWPDGEGAPLAARLDKTWRVGPADRARPNPEGWLLTAPVTPDAPVDLRLEEPLDHALLERLITVESSDGERIEGSSLVFDGDRRWSFAPATPWPPGGYVVRVAPSLEDLAGNSLSRLFDEPLDADRIGVPEMQPVTLPFEIGERPGS